MAKIKKKEIITACMNDRVLCRIFLRYDTNYRYCIPLLISDRLFPGAEEDAGITSITFDSRYINIYSKYLSDLPDNFGR